MKFLPLVWAGLWRKRARTVFTLLSVFIAFTLFGLLQGVNSAFDQIIERQRLDRLIVEPRFLLQQLPLAYRARIESIPGIRLIVPVQFVGGSYQDPRNGLTILWTEPANWLAMRPEWQISAAELDRTGRTRNAAVLSEWLAQHNNLKVGDTFTLQTGMPHEDGNPNWTFEVAGIMRMPGLRREARVMLAHYTYMDEGRIPMIRGTVSRYLLQIDDPARSAEVAKRVDALFAASGVATRTMNEQEQAESQISNLGDIKFFTRAIMAAVFFALLLVTSHTTMESVRERTNELAVLKTLGFSDRRVLGLVLAESAVLFTSGALAGLAAAAALFPLTRRLVGATFLPGEVIVLGLSAALLAALVSASIPAWRARRLSIVDALAVR